MNLVETIPELKEARLNGLEGVGYAEVITGPGNNEHCRGVIVFDDHEEVADLSETQAMYEGIVYRNGEVYQERMAVEVVFFNNDNNQDPGATFVAV